MKVQTITIDSIEGLGLSGPGPEPARRWVSISALVRTGESQQSEARLEVPLLDALYLLNLLEAMSKDAQLDHLRRPPGTTQ